MDNAEIKIAILVSAFTFHISGVADIFISNRNATRVIHTHFVGPKDDPLLHTLIREWMPRLTDTELRIVLVIFNKTRGYGKERDWISHLQFKKAIRSKNKYSASYSRHISKALTAVIVTHGIVQAESENGKRLTTASQRMKNYGKIYYRISPVIVSPHSGRRPLEYGSDRAYYKTVDNVGINGYIPVEKV